MEKRMSFFVLFLAFLLPYLAATLALVLPTVSQAAVGLDGSVEVSEENFPDERFRALAVYLDVNRDNVLSLEERSVLKELTVDSHWGDSDSIVYTEAPLRLGLPWNNKYKYRSSYCTDEYSSDLKLVWSTGEVPKKLNIKGIEYFPELQGYSVIDYMNTVGSLRGNAKLTDVYLSDASVRSNSEPPFEMEDCSKIDADFSAERLASLHIKGFFRCKQFSLPHATALKELILEGESEDDECRGGPVQIGQLDLSANGNLQELTLKHVQVGMSAFMEAVQEVDGCVDLRRNKKLQSVSIGGVKVCYDLLAHGGQVAETFTRIGMPYTMTREKYHLKLPKNNCIQKLTYVTKDDSLDLSECRKLRYLRVQAGMKLKLNRRWYQSFGRKNLMLVVRGTKTAKKVSSRTKKYLYIKASRLRGQVPPNTD